AVQDTFAHYVNLYAMGSDNMSTSWGINSCCDDPTFAEGLPQGYSVLQSWFAFNFPEAGMRSDFFVNLMRSPYFELKDYELHGDMAAGLVDIEMPVPGTTDEMVSLQNVRFNMRIANEAPITHFLPRT
ncbi:MAG: hypothetical protein AAF570_03525, partial [Bacteroidota bacterium]